MTIFSKFTEQVYLALTVKLFDTLMKEIDEGNLLWEKSKQTL